VIVGGEERKAHYFAIDLPHSDGETLCGSIGLGPPSSIRIGEYRASATRSTSGKRTESLRRRVRSVMPLIANTCGNSSPIKTFQSKQASSRRS
jgi:hypothetical protein